MLPTGHVLISHLSHSSSHYLTPARHPTLLNEEFLLKRKKCMKMGEQPGLPESQEAIVLLLYGLVCLTWV